MNEEKRNYLIINEGFNFVISGFKEDAIKIAKKIEKIEIENYPRIFEIKIEQEIKWQKQEEKKEIFENEEYRKEEEYAKKMVKMLEKTSNHIFSLFPEEQQKIIINSLNKMSDIEKIHLIKEVLNTPINL